MGQNAFARSTRFAWFCWYALTGCLTAFFLADAAYSLLTKPQLPAARLYAAPESAAPRPYAAATGQDILRRNLMQLQPLPSTGTAATPAKTPAKTETPDRGSGPLEAIPVSKRGWQLLGTVASDTPLESHAAIVAGGKQRLYREGEMLDDWLVERILRKTVILHRGGERERLVLEVALPAAGPRQTVPSQPTAGQTTTGPEAFAASANPGSPSLAAALAANPANFLRDIALRPKSLGAQQGMEITSLRAESPLHGYGLRNGDIVLTVNDIPLTSYDDLPKLLVVLQNDQVRVRVVRLGKELVLE